MVQYLVDKTPAYCLRCIRTDNKFSAELVLKCWSYIYSELSKQGIDLLSTTYGRLEKIKGYASFNSVAVIIPRISVHFTST